MYIVQGDFGFGWENMSYEDTRGEAEQTLREFCSEDSKHNYRVVRR